VSRDADQTVGLPRTGAQRVAVIGSGISGLAAAWLLARRHRVSLFEADTRPGGHTHTVPVTLDGITHPVDTGFLVFNRRTYPNLTALFELLGVRTAASDMSFSVSLAQPRLEWAGSSLATVFAQKANAARPAFWRMLQDIARFNREATRLALGGEGAGRSLGDYLRENRYGDSFRDWYLLPMAAAIWSCPTGRMLAYPVETFARFCHNHGLLQLTGRPSWMTVRGGGREYVSRMLAQLPDVRLGTPVVAARRAAGAVWLHSARERERFDAVVFACHSDQALGILGGDASPEERELLGAVGYQSNRAVLHTDTRLLPRRRAVWSAWNYLAGKGPGDQRPVSVSYLINRLQPLPFASPVIVSLNPFVEPRGEHVIGEFHYAHPVFDAPAIAAQGRLGSLQGRRNTWYCGAWTGYGFHEDGLRSALEVANRFGVLAPWQGGAMPQPRRAA
jgi:predicted NAD/FAD-binding protein